MNKFISYTFMIILIFITGCNGRNTSSEPSTTTSQAQASPISTLSPSMLTQTPPSATKKTDLMIGDTLKDQSFQIDFENFGKSEIITTIEKVNDNNRPHFYFKNGGSLSELKYEQESPGFFYSVSAVSFRDVSGDGKKDIIVIYDYITGVGYMGAIPVSQLLIFKQTESGFAEDKTIEEKARAGIPYRILTVQDVMVGLKTAAEDSIANAWQRLHLGTYELDGSGELGGSTLTIKKASGDGLVFNLDAFYAADKKALKQGGVNIGTIESGNATPSYADMIFRDKSYELSFYLISGTDIYVRDNGQPYFGHNVYVNGTYSLKK